MGVSWGGPIERSNRGSYGGGPIEGTPGVPIGASVGCWEVPLGVLWGGPIGGSMGDPIWGPTGGPVGVPYGGIHWGVP